MNTSFSSQKIEMEKKRKFETSCHIITRKFFSQQITSRKFTIRWFFNWYICIKNTIAIIMTIITLNRYLIIKLILYSGYPRRIAAFLCKIIEKINFWVSDNSSIANPTSWFLIRCSREKIKENSLRDAFNDI